MAARDPFVDGRQFRRFSKGFVRQTKGRWAGEPLILEPWQGEIVDELLRRDPVTGLRVHREALIGIPRKNGKSTLSSAIALYFLIVEGTLYDPGAEVYAAAGSKDQARIVFEQAKAFVQASPRLLSLCDVQRDRILVKETGAVFRVLSSDAPRQHGLNPSCVVIDELHAHKNGDLYEALTTADMAREEPLVVTITTAGHDLDSILGEVFLRGSGPMPVYDEEAGIVVPWGEKPADFFFRWYAAAEDAFARLRAGDESALDAIAAANPASWITPEKLRSRWERMKSTPRGQASFERLHANRWTSAEESWLPPAAWDALLALDLALEPGDDVFAGVDMGRSHDTAAVALVGPEKMDEEEGRLRRPVGGCVWGVHSDPKKPAPAAHEIVDGDRIPFAAVEDFLREVARTYTLREAGYDPWRFDRSAEDLYDEGIEMVEFPQTNARMAPASQGLYDAVVDEYLAHDGDPVFRAHVEAAVARDLDRDTWRLDKRKTAAPMDWTVALSIALALASADNGGGFTVRAMDADGDATPDPGDAPEGLDERIADLVYREREIDWSGLSAEASAKLADALRAAADLFEKRHEPERAQTCRDALAARRAALR